MGIYKESYNENRSILGEVLPLDTPYTILLDVSDVCNFRCNYCFRSDNSNFLKGDYKNNEIMSYNTFLKAANQIKEFPGIVKRLSFSHNGEPLCNPLLPDMIKYASDNKLAECYEFHTNASLLTHEKIDKLLESGLNRIIISLQGLSSETYKSVCSVNIDMEKFYSQLKYLYENKGPDLVINIKIVDIALKENERELFIEKYSKVSDRVFIENVVSLWGVEESDKSNDFFVNKYGKKEKWQHCCPLVFYTIGILPSGIIYPCSHINPPFKLGNVHNNTLYQAWNSEKRINFLKDMLKNGRDTFENCRLCYVPQNTITSNKDIIDEYRNDIFEKIEKNNVPK